jgi:low temperature requirement protein LtrA
VSHWWQRPALRTDEEEERERTVTPLELFFDLVFVAAVAVFAHELGAHVSWQGLGEFILRFLPLIWIWAGATVYTDRFETDDVSHRLYLFALMLPVAGLAFFAHDAFEEDSVGFALSYAGARLLIIVAWLRAGYHNPGFRPVSNRYSVGFAAAILLWIVSLAVPTPWRFGFWIAAIVIDIATPLFTLKEQRRLPRISSSHFTERLGLFTILVLGESVVGVASGIAGLETLSLEAGLTGAIGLLMAAALWWIYFDFVGGAYGHRYRPGIWWTYAWLYLHTPLLISYTAIGAAMLEIMSHATEPPSDAIRWLICGATAGALLAIAAIEETEEQSGHHMTHDWRDRAARLAGAGAAMALALLGGSLEPYVLVALLAGILAAQVADALLQQEASEHAVRHV